MDHSTRIYLRLILCLVIALVFGGMFILSSPGLASPQPIITATPTFNRVPMAQPATVVPPAQADNGAQLYWSMCSTCHGDRGQGLTQEWRNAFSPSERDCWGSGCHGSDYPQHSFEIPITGAPAIIGIGKLARFSNAFELHSFIRANMPYFPAASLTAEETWALTAYILKQNGMQPENLDLNKDNSAAIPLHRKVKLPESGIPGTLILAGILSLAAVGLGILASRKFAPLPAHAKSPNFFLHLHPPSIPAEQSRLRYTLAAGGLAVFLMIILFITGILEMYYYIPTTEQAAISVQTISTLVPLGSLVRNLHYWSAQFLIITVTIHLLRVALTGAYAPPRRFNYILGLGLFVLVLLFDFTGYMLRWDEGVRWALVVGTNLLKTIPVIGSAIYQFVIGGSEPGSATLTRFYTWHIYGLTLFTGILLVWHIFRVRRDGGIAIPPPPQRQDQDRITRLELLRREVLAMLVAGTVILLFSLIVPAPIDQPISISQALVGDSRAPWFFLWIQQLLKFGNPFWWGVITPLAVVLGLGLLPYVLPNSRKGELGQWFPAGNRIAQVLTVVIISVILLLTIWGAITG